MSLHNVPKDVQQICTWLGLPPNCWPPDHYTLLGLAPGEQNIERIEQQVHERLMRVRPYQLSHAGLATEAMMHLAKAFDCLTNPPRKKAYDAANFPHLMPAPSAMPSARAPTVLDIDTAKSLPVPSQPPPAPPAQAPKPETVLRLQWQATVAPPPIRMMPGASEPPAPVAGQAAVEPPPVRIPPAVIPAPEAIAGSNGTIQPAPADLAPPTAAQPPTSFSCFMLDRLATRRDFLEHLWWTRRLARAWNRAGKYLNKPKRPLVKPVEGAELTRMLFAIDDLLQEVPGLLGEPGQTGYRIVALCSQEPVAEHFNSLDEQSRKALAKDWNAGCEILAEHRKFLMVHLKSRRQLTRWQRFRRAVDALLTAYHRPVMLVLVLIVLVALLIVWITSL